MITLNAELLRSIPLPRHEQGDNKEGRGQVLVVGGCLAVPGAILLSAEGALRAGAGKLQIATCQAIAAHLGLAVQEAMVIGLPTTDDGDIGREASDIVAKYGSRAAATLIGPGMSGSDDLTQVVAALLDSARDDEATFVLDAGALNALEHCLEPLHRSTCNAIITPHDGEMAKLLGVSRDEVAGDPLNSAREATKRFRCVSILKSAVTYVTAPDGQEWSFDGGTIGLGTSGSGDVLAGIIAGLAARGTPAAEAALWGVYLHAEAGTRLTRRYGGIGLLARELPGEIPAIMAGFTL